jgi:hypothetical protein
MCLVNFPHDVAASRPFPGASGAADCALGLDKHGGVVAILAREEPWGSAGITIDGRTA